VLLATTVVQRGRAAVWPSRRPAASWRCCGCSPRASQCDSAGTQIRLFGDAAAVHIGGDARGYEELGLITLCETGPPTRTLPFAGAGHLIIEALRLAAPAREMDGDVGGYLDPLRQHLLIRLYACFCSEAGNSR
jgi:hypothetical protein